MPERAHVRKCAYLCKCVWAPLCVCANGSVCVFDCQLMNEDKERGWKIKRKESQIFFLHRCSISLLRKGSDCDQTLGKELTLDRKIP